MTNTEGLRDKLVLKRVFNAPVERVFDAWTKPEVLANWFGPQGFTVKRSELQLYVGGSYEIEICSPDGIHIRHFGNYLEISKPHKLAFTWMLVDQSCKGSEGLVAQTVVSIGFKPIKQTTELTLTHEQLPSKESLDGHKFGWSSSLDSLTHFLQ
ncbi:SRPBCC domain-containing protein [Alginatibacterium sediminis]|uniref:SRPBCC domain-containing protein n=1 Tax=Alginatibacterium sediminis TaxID=2164068 RepID=A0A420EFP4_9ALTE|nr:SRPBCC domain-containing protein [Alginatibacterium sediminis]RKF19529.1 SRPBCC domain-containing protein [Alginatibacterium sediminis]